MNEAIRKMKHAAASLLTEKRRKTAGAFCILAIIGSLLFAGQWATSVESLSIEREGEGERASDDATASLCVYACGSVVNPGVYELQEGSRVIDAVTAAGGFSDDADKTSLNLARIVNDSEQIYVSSMAEKASLANENGMGDGKETRININSASLSDLEKLPGVGEATAKKIIAYRDAHGSFLSVDELVNVSGIGERKLAEIRDYACV